MTRKPDQETSSENGRDARHPSVAHRIKPAIGWKAYPTPGRPGGWAIAELSIAARPTGELLHASLTAAAHYVRERQRNELSFRLQQVEEARAALETEITVHHLPKGDPADG